MQEKQRRTKRVIKLMLCPFCGGSADVFTSYDNPDIFHVKCEDCYSRTGWFRDPEDAMRAWNRRAGNE